MNLLALYTFNLHMFCAIGHHTYMNQILNNRRVPASVTTLQVKMLHYTNPWIAVAWSFFFPGAGHLLVGEYFLGWILFLWELCVNSYTKFNTAILYSFTGRFTEAKQLLGGNHKWIIVMYSGVFVFTLLSSYKVAVESNQANYLAHKENAPFKIFSINAFGHNFITKRSPIVGAGWSMIMPGLGAMWTHRIVTAVFELIFWLIVMWKSNLLAGIEYTAIGSFGKAVDVVNPEWILFVSSLYCFLVYYTYIITVEENKLFDLEQASLLVRSYQRKSDFSLHIQEESSKMRFIATFDHSVYVERALLDLESVGVKRNDIFATGLDKRNTNSVWFDTLQRSDGKAVLDGVALLGGLGCALGTIYGFVLPWGPVLWGLIGFGGGSLIGLLIELLILNKTPKRKQVSKTEVVIIIDCADENAKIVEDILWQNKAFGISNCSKTQAIE